MSVRIYSLRDKRIELNDLRCRFVRQRSIEVDKEQWICAFLREQYAKRSFFEINI